MLHQSELFSSRWMRFSYTFAWYLMYPSYWSVDKMLSSFISTTDEIAGREEDPCYERMFYLTFLIPTYLVVLLTFLPFALIGLAIWIPLQKRRHPYVYSKNERLYPKAVEDWDNARYGIASVDVALLPEFLAKNINLQFSHWRAKEIGQKIINSQLHPKPKIFIHSPSDADMPTMDSFSREEPPINANSPADVGQPCAEGIAGSVSGDCTNMPVKIVGNGSAKKDRSPWNTAGNGMEGVSMANTSMLSSDNMPFYLPMSTPPPVKHSMCQDDNDATTLDQEDPDGSDNQKIGSLGFPLSSVNECLCDASNMDCICPSLNTDINFPPNLDFLCLQGVHDRSTLQALVQKLHHSFGYIIYDAVMSSWDTNRYGFNSGLLFASTYPILDVNFNSFQNSEGESLGFLEKWISKGLLQVKVLLSEREDRRLVGYFSILHLQEDELAVEYRQLSKVSMWIKDFQEATTDVEKDVLGLDILAGNFGSEVHQILDPTTSKKQELLETYGDPLAHCRIACECARTFNLGTRLCRPHIYENEVATPEGLLRVLEDPILCQEFLEKRNSDVGTETGRLQTDYILYKNNISQFHQKCEEYFYVSQFATLTDHLPIVVTISVQQKTEMMESSNPISQENVCINITKEEELEEGSRGQRSTPPDLGKRQQQADRLNSAPVSRAKYQTSQCNNSPGLTALATEKLQRSMEVLKRVVALAWTQTLGSGGGGGPKMSALADQSQNSICSGVPAELQCYETTV